MIIGLVTTAPSQWKKLSTSGPPTPGEEIFIAAGESNDLVREHRADDDDLVIFEEQPVDLRPGHPSRKGRRTIPGFRPPEWFRSFGSACGIVPGVVEEAERGRRPTGVPPRRFPAAGKWRLGHGLMGSQGDEDVEGLGQLGHLLVNSAWNNRPTGAVRVPSGTMSRIFLSRYSLAGQAWARSSGCLRGRASGAGCAIREIIAVGSMLVPGLRAPRRLRSNGLAQKPAVDANVRPGNEPAGLVLARNTAAPISSWGTPNRPIGV